MKIFRNVVPVILISILILAFVGHFSTALAVTNSASATITVMSTSGYAISGVNVIFTSRELPYPLTVRTDNSGVASFPNLPTGEFTLTASSNYFMNSSPVRTGILTTGQSVNDTFILTPDNTSKGIDNLFANNNLSEANSFEGTVSWSTYGLVAVHSEMRLQFMDYMDTPIGSVINSVYSNDTNYYSITVPMTTVPSGATRIGVTLLNADSSVVDTKTIPLWNFNLHGVRSLKFHDNDPNGGTINAVVTWSGANDKASLAGYNIYYWMMGENQWKYWDTVVKNADETYEYVFDSLPAKTGAILVGSVNSAGEELPSYPTVYVIDNRQADTGTVLSAAYSDTLPAPSNIQDYTYSIAANTISGQIGFTLPSDRSNIQGYNLYFSDVNGVNIQAIATIYSPSSTSQLYYYLDNSQQIPADATQIAIYSYGKDGKESAPIFLPIKIFNNSVPSTKLPHNLSFEDMDEQASHLRGFLTWNRAADELNLNSYQIYFLNSANLPISKIGEVLKGDAPQLTLPSGLSIPAAAASIGIGVKDMSGKVSTNFALIPISDNITEAQVQAAVRSAYFSGAGPLNLAQIDAFLLQTTNIYPFEKKDVQLFLSLIDPYFIQN